MDYRTNIYLKPEEKIKLIRKANKMGISLSRLLVNAALNYKPGSVETGATKQ